MAARSGYFGDEGLDVELLTEPCGVHAENELLAGYADLARPAHPL